MRHFVQVLVSLHWLAVNVVIKNRSWQTIMNKNSILLWGSSESGHNAFVIFATFSANLPLCLPFDNPCQQNLMTKNVAFHRHFWFKRLFSNSNFFEPVGFSWGHGNCSQKNFYQPDKKLLKFITSPNPFGVWDIIWQAISAEMKTVKRKGAAPAGDVEVLQTQLIFLVCRSQWQLHVENFLRVVHLALFGHKKLEHLSCLRTQNCQEWPL